MYFCRKCNLTVDDEALGTVREWHSECERDCYEDLTNYDCPECGRELTEACECSRCDCAAELDELCFDENGLPVCKTCYYGEEDRPSVFSVIKERARRYGEFIFTHDRIADPA